MNLEADENPLLLVSQHYPIGMGQFVPEQGASANMKPRGRRGKNKGDEGGGGDGDVAMMRKRKLSEKQVSMLEQSFGSEKKLESERKDRLAAELGLDPRQVAVWFQNRRARWRSKKLEEEYSRLRSEHETTVVEKCRLETQLLKIKEQLYDAEKEIKRLSERTDGFTSNSPSSSLSMENMDGFENMFHLPEDYNYYVHGAEWDDIYKYF